MSHIKQISVEVPFSYCSKCMAVAPVLVDYEEKVEDGRLVVVNPGRRICSQENFCIFRDGSIKR